MPATLDLTLHPKQGVALTTPANEVLYGGAAGGGASAIASGPSCVSGLSLAPIRMPSITPLIASANSSCRLRETMARLSIAQTCPLIIVIVLPKICAAASIGAKEDPLAVKRKALEDVQRELA